MSKRFPWLLILFFGLSACVPVSVATGTNPANTASLTATQSASMIAPTATALSSPQPTALSTVVASTHAPLSPIELPAGFGIGVYASGLNAPRMLAIGPDGLLYVAERGAGQVVRLAEINGDGEADEVQVVASGLTQPNSLAFAPDGSLYVSETTRVWRLSQPDAQGVYQQREKVITGLPGGGHSTRTLLFSPDGTKLFVSVGSSCNVCRESEVRRATIMVFNADGSDGQVYAAGLRNAVGLVFRPGTQELWATNNGRDNLGDALPPETVYQIVAGGNYGWPVCHAGRIIDPDFGSVQSCDGVEPPQIELAAHMAPLGLTFYTGTQFPAAYQGGLFIALHGSWNSSVPVGYKLMWVPMSGGHPGVPQDFATGWLRSDGSVWGRPVDVINSPDGSLFVSDDLGGNIYRIYYQGD
jgi:glucose/arabinose dehydrogenase